MLEGQQAYDDHGNQVMLFPLDYLACTQTYGYNSYSHCCNKATDWGYSTPNYAYPYYAPCDCEQLGISGADNICRYRSVNRVVTPSGLKYVSFCFMHDDNPPTFSRVIRQGELIGHMGNAGTSSGFHVHIDQCQGTDFILLPSQQSCQVGGTCYYPDNELEPARTYFLTGDETIVTTLGIDYEVWDGEIHPYRPNFYSPVLWGNKRAWMRKRGLI